jgi:hypothetical protein
MGDAAPANTACQYVDLARPSEVPSEIDELPERGHSPVIEVCAPSNVLEFIRRLAQPRVSTTELPPPILPKNLLPTLAAIRGP